MFDTDKKLDVTQDELAVIEAALHTQAKILSVQAAAGGSGARRRLNEVKRVLTHVASHREAPVERPARSLFRWFGTARTPG
ncbi:MAG: hypothetical protein AAF744_15300 [Pseudomonadota bacterium]